jgi:hypothetical protein
MRQPSVEPLLHRGSHPYLTGVGQFLLILFAPACGEVLVVSRHGDEGFIGHTFIQLPALDAGVAAFDVMIQKVERRTGVVGFQPERDFAEFVSINLGTDSMTGSPGILGTDT